MADPRGTIIVTGANGGLGTAIVSQIISAPDLNASYHGIYIARNVATAKSLDTAIVNQVSRSATPHSHEKISLDLSNLSDVRTVAGTINRRVAEGMVPRIHAIVLNAGYEEFEKQTWTEDGLDTSFATNYLGHWLLSMLLLQSIDADRGRVLWICSWSHNPHDPRNSWNGAFKEAKYNIVLNSNNIDAIARGQWSLSKDDMTGWAAGYRRYGASKLCGVVAISELQRRLDQDSALNNVSVLGIDPGLVNTGIVRQSGSWVLRVFLWQLLLPALRVILGCFISNGPLRSARKSASDIIAAALMSSPPPLSARPKALYLNGSELGIRNPEALDPAKGSMLWRDTIRYTQLESQETCLEHWC
ncbi:putative short-chain dehydrogenase [Aaosphaeria arxii CBS 175.79]|uniref:3beta-hydroxysteroid 3-dehydrogenase n=1 Tax=Aaosphaeria arxii CBS 175.79 TaxID=1450172 RepID=A0A6A5X8R2_9PLEO|nr:putative short-chain dehydrogenase [Aaosphaeria arxii CBS 175.79]KAF2009348.1 putative short-chain dehydrogenase [Aaosphaeria arxii CBS 175.79]